MSESGNTSTRTTEPIVDLVVIVPGTLSRCMQSAKSLEPYTFRRGIAFHVGTELLGPARSCRRMRRRAGRAVTSPRSNVDRTISAY